MISRRVARNLALDVLYESEIRDLPPRECLALREEHGWVVEGSGDEGGPTLNLPERPDAEALDYARELVEGVQDNQPEIDRLIGEYADHWTIERMPLVDRNLIRMALFELLWRDDVPVPVAINEAVDLAKSLSTEDSGRFVNGLLGRIAEERGANDHEGPG